MSATDELRPWWERHPARLRWELANFADVGLDAEVDDPAGDGPVIRSGLTLSDGNQVTVHVRFPFEYPLRDPKVCVPAGLIGLPHEVDGQLCLLDNPGAHWHPQRSAAELVHENARQLLEDTLVGGAGVVAAREEQIPNRASNRYITDNSHVVMVPDPFWQVPPEGICGGALVLVGEGDRRLLEQAEHLGQCDKKLKGRMLCAKGVALGRWATFDEAPPGVHSAKTMFQYARERAPELMGPFQIGERELPPEWIALTYPEEGPRRGEWRRGWTFIEMTGPETIPPSAQRMPQTQALTLAERQLRLPELVGIEAAKIVLVGVGSLGSKVAIELCKAGVGQLVLIDDDRYDVNNAVRHELAVWLAGTRKSLGMALSCQQANPFSDVEWDTERVGSGPSSAKQLLDRLDSAHLVVETTGSRIVTRVVERYCRIAEVPLLTASLTRGSRGGDMALLRRDDCFDCFLLAQEQGNIPKPDQTDQELIIPVGCSDPAFSGTGFDASSLASDVARMAIRATGLSSYAQLDHNWALANFVREPRWQQGAMAPDPKCGHHR